MKVYLEEENNTLHISTDAPDMTDKDFILFLLNAVLHIVEHIEKKRK